MTGFLYNMRNPTASANPYPAICPRCDEDRRRRRLDTRSASFAPAFRNSLKYFPTA